MGEGRNYNQEDEEPKTAKIKKTTTIEATTEDNNNDEVPTPNTGDKPVQDREPSDDEPTSDDERYKAASG